LVDVVGICSFTGINLQMMLRTLFRQRLFSSARRSKGRSDELEPVVSKFITNSGRLPELDIKSIGDEGSRILGNMEKEMSKIRIGRAAPCNKPKSVILLIYFLAMLDSIKVVTEGYVAALSSIATISIQDPQRLVVNPFESSVRRSSFQCLSHSLVECKEYYCCN
jgi:hypothetical protein